MFEKKHGKRFLASVMALVMLLSLAPVGALAADEETPNPEENTAVEGSTPAVVETPSEDTPTTQPAQDPKPVVADPVESSSEAVILPEEDLLDQAFGVNPDAANSNGIAEYKGGNSSQGAVTSIDAEFWLTNRHASVDGVWTKTINTNTVSANGTAVTDLAPAERRATADETYDTVFWQARVLGQGKHQTINADDDKTSSGTEIVSIRYNDGLEYQAKGSSNWTAFSRNDQLVFYYLIRTDYTEMVQIDVSDWTVKNEPTLEDRHSVTYQVIVDGGKDNGKVLDSEKFWYNKAFTVSSVRVRQTESENYTISKVELEPTALGTVAKESGEYQFSLNLENANTDEATVKIYVEPNVVPHELNYVLNGGEIDADSAYTAAGEVYPDVPVVTPTLSKKDCTFDGWYTDPAFTSKWTGTTMPNANLTLYAKWTATNPDPKPDPDPEPTPTTTDVYVYFKMVDTAGKNISKDKINNDDLKKTVYNNDAGGSTWATLGKITLTGDITESKLEDAGKVAQDQLKNAGNLWRENKGIAETVLANIQWFQLKRWDGATDYVSNGSRWHLDGKITGYTVTYNEGADDGTVKDMPATDGKYYLSGSDYTVSVATPTRDGYVFTGWKSNIENDTTIYNTKGKFKMPAKNVVLTAQWAEDKVGEKGNDGKDTGDGIPDAWQYKVTFKVENGSWNDETNADIVKYVTKKDTAGNASATGMATLKKEDVPAVGNKPNEGYVAGEWDVEPANQTITSNDSVFTYTYKEPAKPNAISYTINRHLMIKDGDEVDLENKLLKSGSSNENTLLNSLITSDMKNAQKYAEKNYVYVDSKTIYTVDKNEKKLTDEDKLTGVTTIDLYYYLDVIGGKDGEDNPIDKGDEIPDCYQVTIIYKSSDESRGKISDASLKKEVLTIEDTEGNRLSSGKVEITGASAQATGSRCYFSSWTNDADVDTSKAGAELGKQTIENAKGGETYTFTANFGRSSGGSSRPSTPPTVDIPDDDVPTGLNGADHYAYIIGYGNNDVRPQQSITRAEVATIFFRLLTDETREANMTKNQNYSDVKDSDWYCRAVATLSSMGIIKGYNDGTFQPNAPITRAEFAAIAARFDPDGDTTPATFSDVGSHWAKDEISIAANHGWINGYEDGTFKPDRNITRAEAVTLINRVLKRLPETKEDLHEDMKTWVDNMDETAWYYLAIQEATNGHYNTNKEGTQYETWTDLRENRDWSELEK